MALGRSLTYTRNRIGPRILPRGTSDHTESRGDDSLQMLT